MAALNRIHIESTRKEVFDVLSDAARYPDWVVGAATLVTVSVARKTFVPVREIDPSQSLVAAARQGR
jgi:hypothetical protein